MKASVRPNGVTAAGDVVREPAARDGGVVVAVLPRASHATGAVHRPGTDGGGLGRGGGDGGRCRRRGGCGGDDPGSVVASRWQTHLLSLIHI